MAAVPSLQTDVDSHRMPLGRRTSARQALRQRSTSKPNHSESQQSPSATTRGNTKSQPRAISISHSEQPSACYESSDDDLPMPMKLSALTRALLNDGQPQPGALCAVPSERLALPSAQPPLRVCTRRRALDASTLSTSKDHSNLRESVPQHEARTNTRADNLQLRSANSTSPAASRSQDNSPSPGKGVVRLSNTLGRETMQDGVRRSMSASALRTRARSRENFTEEGSHFETQAEKGERQPKLEHAQTSINTPVSSVHTARVSVASPGQTIRSAGSSAMMSKHIAVDSDAGTTENPATAEPTNVADSVGGVSQRKEDPELRSTTRPKRVIRVSGSLLSGPARRGRQRLTEEDAEAHGQETLIAAQDCDSQPAAIDQPAMALSTSKLHSPATLGSPLQTREPSFEATGRRASSVRLFDMHAQQNASQTKLPHRQRVPEMPSVQIKEISKAARPLSLDTGSGAPQRALISESRGFNVKGQNTSCQPTPSQPPPKMSVVETVTATQLIKKRQLMLKVNGRSFTRVGLIGRGGSGKVYRVATESGRVLALKRVSLIHTDELVEKGLLGEIRLLQRLRNVERVIQLIDYELNREKQSLSVVSIFVFYRLLPSS